MTLSVLLQRIQALSAYTDDLTNRLHSRAAMAGDPRPTTDPATVLEDLASAVEELRAAEGELRSQTEALMGVTAQLEAEQRRYQDLFEFVPDPSVVTDANGIIREANRAVSPLLGFARKYALGKPLAAFVAEDECQSFRTRLAGLFDDDPTRNRVHEWEVRLRPQRREAPVATVVRVGAIRDGQDALVGMRWLFRDITARKRIEEQISAHEAELERRVKERTAQLESIAHINRSLLAQEQAARADAEAALHEKEATLRSVVADLDRLLRALGDSSGTAAALGQLLNRLANSPQKTPPLRVVPHASGSGSGPAEADAGM